MKDGLIKITEQNIYKRSGKEAVVFVCASSRAKRLSVLCHRKSNNNVKFSTNKITLFRFLFGPHRLSSVPALLTLLYMLLFDVLPCKTVVHLRYRAKGIKWSHLERKIYERPSARANCRWVTFELVYAYMACITRNSGRTRSALTALHCTDCSALRPNSLLKILCHDFLMVSQTAAAVARESLERERKQAVNIEHSSWMPISHCIFS